MLVFEICDRHGNKTLYEFTEGEYTLGKGDQCDVILSDSHVSRVHASFKVDKSKTQITDNRSTNGTWLNGVRLDGMSALKKSDTLVFGDLTITILEAPARVNAFETGEDRRFNANPVQQESEEFIALKRRVHSLILEYLDLRKRANLQEMNSEELREEAEKATTEIIRDHVRSIPDGISRDELRRQVVAEAVGLGALEPLVNDDAVTEIMVNGPDQIFIEKDGRLQLSESRFTSNQSLIAVIDRWSG